MTYLSDLHTHSTASDGQYAPSELVRLAKEQGLQVLALTDHDIVDGVAEAVQAGEGLLVLPGVELGAKEHKNLHILGYRFDPAAPGLTALCRQMKAGREERKYRIIDYLRERGGTSPWRRWKRWREAAPSGGPISPR